jgi:hypothetical protein
MCIGAQDVNIWEISLAHLRTFGALVTTRKPGKRPAKADRHTDHGVLPGYGSTPKHVRYFDQNR